MACTHLLRACAVLADCVLWPGDVKCRLNWPQGTGELPWPVSDFITVIASANKFAKFLVGSCGGWLWDNDVYSVSLGPQYEAAENVRSSKRVICGRLACSKVETCVVPDGPTALIWYRPEWLHSQWWWIAVSSLYAGFKCKCLFRFWYFQIYVFTGYDRIIWNPSHTWQDLNDGLWCWLSESCRCSVFHVGCKLWGLWENVMCSFSSGPSCLQNTFQASNCIMYCQWHAASSRVCSLSALHLIPSSLFSDNATYFTMLID